MADGGERLKERRQAALTQLSAGSTPGPSSRRRRRLTVVQFWQHHADGGREAETKAEAGDGDQHQHQEHREKRAGVIGIGSRHTLLLY